jgi:NAD(P)-dependent dehydrogenase (short-subunit alcohol dehydrogenase family)
MANVFITGSTAGLGLMAAQLLIDSGHRVVLHARDHERAEAARASAPGCKGVLIGDLSHLRGMHQIAEQANRLGPFDAVIHNAGIGYREPRRIETEDGLSHVFATNVLAPYVLTALMHKPKRLIYISSAIHDSAEVVLDDLCWTRRPWNGRQAYAESKLYDLLLAFGFARLWPDVYSNAVEPGWIATRMGGPEATDDLSQAHLTQAWLAVSDEPLALSSGEYFYHKALRPPLPLTREQRHQNALLEACARLSGVEVPRAEVTPPGARSSS